MLFNPLPKLTAFLYPGLIGPGIPLNQSGAGGSEREDVTLAAGFDSDFFNFFPWKLRKDGNSSGKYGRGGFVVLKFMSIGPLHLCFRGNGGTTSQLLDGRGGGPFQDRAVQQALLRRHRSTRPDRQWCVGAL